jgi:cbb3-type cytochrome oxidase subunit 3
MLLFAAIMSLFYLDVFAEIAAALWLALVTIALVSGVYLAPRIRRTLGVDRLVKRLPGRVRVIAAEVDAAFLHYRGHLAGIGLWIAAGPVIYGFAAASLLLVDRALGVGLDLTDYLLLMPLVAIATAVPIAPNGWGIGEAVYGNLIARLGVPLLGDVPHAVATMRTRGVALSIVSRIILTLISLAGGLFLLRRSGRASLAEARAGAEGPDARSTG